MLHSSAFTMSPILLDVWRQASSEHSIAFYVAILLSTYVFWRITYQLYLYPRFLSPLRRVPGPPLGSALVGQFGEIINGEAGIPQRAWVKQYGPVVRVVGPVGIERLIFMNPEAIQKILVSDWTDYPRPKFMRDVLGFATGYGLLTVTGNEHKQMRKAMNPAFSLPNLVAQSDMYYDAIEGLIKIMNNNIASEKDPSQGTQMLMYEWLSKATLDIICATAFGYTSDSLHNPHNELAEAYDVLTSSQNGKNLARFIFLVSIPGVTRLLASRWATEHRHVFAWFAFTEKLYDLLGCMSAIRRVASGMLAEKLADAAGVQADAEAKRDIMSLLVRARVAAQRDAEKRTGSDGGAQARVGAGREVYGMNDEAMMDQVLTFLGAGHETTASGLAWTLWLLAKDPASQQRLREEVAPVFADGARPGYRELKDLQWLDCVVQESLRVMPPVPMTFRQAAKTDYIDGVLVPKGTIFYVPIRVINTWKEVWGDDAEEFKPARWLNLPPKYSATTSTLSFIVGPHACIGKTMSIVEMKAVLGALISNFEFEPAYEGQVPQPTAAVTMKPKDNMPLRVRRVGR
ncbi:cytochrome P450 [Pholiota molesta]|nr:cytochrome P450 [Pholiota molesta]